MVYLISFKLRDILMTKPFELTFRELGDPNRLIRLCSSINIGNFNSMYTVDSRIFNAKNWKNNEDSSRSNLKFVCFCWEPNDPIQSMQKTKRFGNYFPARETKLYDLEHDLYGKLIYILRSSEALIRYTQYKMKNIIWTLHPVILIIKVEINYKLLTNLQLLFVVKIMVRKKHVSTLQEPNNVPEWQGTK